MKELYGLILFSEVSRLVLSVLRIFTVRDIEKRGSQTTQRRGNLTVKQQGFSVCLQVLIGLTSCMASVKGTASEMWDLFCCFLSLGMREFSIYDYELFPKQCFNKMSTGWKLADVPAADLLEMLDGKINNVIFFSSKAIKGQRWLFCQFICCHRRQCAQISLHYMSCNCVSLAFINTRTYMKSIFSMIYSANIKCSTEVKHDREATPWITSTV